MPTEQQMAQASAVHLVRAAVRDYCKHKLFAVPPRGGKQDPLTLPRHSRLAAFTDVDVYTSRPGAGDYGINPLNVRDSTAFPAYQKDVLIGYAGLTGPEALANSAMGSIGPLALQLRRKAPSYRAFLARELRDAQQAPLFIDQVRVMDAFALLDSLDQETLRDLDQSHDGRLSIKAAARKRGVEENTIKKRTMAACDALGALLYALYDARHAA